jgi:hypothetical protein
MPSNEPITAGKAEASPKLLRRQDEIKRSLKKRRRTPGQIAEFIATLTDIDF